MWPVLVLLAKSLLQRPGIETRLKTTTIQHAEEAHAKNWCGYFSETGNYLKSDIKTRRI
ncbi:MAG: hypothetical protein VYE28_03790 [Planctomycetota bacterium]|nr:hypothetical protein [Planctomycetota bacterium]